MYGHNSNAQLVQFPEKFIVLFLAGFQNENKRNQFKEKLNCTIKAWNLVKERLKDGIKNYRNSMQFCIIFYFSSCSS